MGDVSVLFPAVHLYTGGATGNSHGKDYYIADPVKACVNSAILQVCLAKYLLSNNAEKAQEIIKAYKPQFESIDKFIEYKNSITMNKTVVTYNDNGTIRLDF